MTTWRLRGVLALPKDTDGGWQGQGLGQRGPLASSSELPSTSFPREDLGGGYIDKLKSTRALNPYVI